MRGKGNQPHPEMIALAAVLILTAVIGAYVLSHSPAISNQGLVGAPSVRLSESLHPVSFIDHRNPQTIEDTIRFIVGNGDEVDQTTKQTFFLVKDQKGNRIGEMVQSSETTIDFDQVVRAQTNARAGLEEPATTLAHTNDSAQSESKTFFLQSSPIGSTIAPPNCTKPKSGQSYTGTIHFCPGIYELKNGITIIGPATLDGTGVTLVGPGYCSATECATGIYAFGKDITISNITLKGWGGGINAYPAYTWDPITQSWMIGQGNVHLRKNVILKTNNGVSFSGTNSFLEENSIEAQRPMWIGSWWDGAAGYNPTQNTSISKNKLSILLQAGPGLQKYPQYYSYYYSLDLGYVENSIISENVIQPIAFECIKCTSYGIRAYEVNNTTIEKNTIGGVNQAFSIYQSNGWVLNENDLSNVKTWDNGFYSVTYFAGGGTISRNTISGNGSFGIGVYDTFNWGPFNTCFDNGSYYFNNTIKGVGFGYFEEYAPNYYALQGYCTLGSVTPSIFQANNLIQNQFSYIFDPNPPALSSVLNNYYDTHPCVDQNPVDQICDNPYEWDPQGYSFWTPPPNKDYAPVKNMWT